MLDMSRLSHDSVPRTMSGSVFAKKVWNSVIFPGSELQLRTAILKLSFLTVLLRAGAAVACGDDLACGVPGEPVVVGLTKMFDKSTFSDVGVEMFEIFIDLIASVNMEYRSSVDVVIGVLKRMELKFGLSHVGHIHEVSVLARVLKKVVDISRQFL